MSFFTGGHRGKQSRQPADFFQQQITKGTKPSALSLVSEEWLCFSLLPPVKTVSEESLRSLRYLLSNSTLPLSSIV